jgi:hypothetical protein
MPNHFLFAFMGHLISAVMEREAKTKRTLPEERSEIRLGKKQYADGEEVMDYLLLLLVGFALAIPVVWWASKQP